MSCIQVQIQIVFECNFLFQVGWKKQKEKKNKTFIFYGASNVIILQVTSPLIYNMNIPHSEYQLCFCRSPIGLDGQVDARYIFMLTPSEQCTIFAIVVAYLHRFHHVYLHFSYSFLNFLLFSFEFEITQDCWRLDWIRSFSHFK